MNNQLEKYKPKINKKEEEKNKILESAVKLFHAREDFISFFEKGIFPFKGNVFKTKEEKSEGKSGEISEEELRKYINNTLTFIKEKLENINNDFFKTYFDFSTPIDLAKNYLKLRIKRKTVRKCLKKK